MTRFVSVLFPGDAGPPLAQAQEPECFRDLNIDQIVEAAVAGREFYDLRSLFYLQLTSVAAVEYRQEVHRDLERCAIREAIDTFAKSMQDMRDCLATASQLHYAYQKQRLFLDAVLTYADALRCLADDLRQRRPSSAGMRAFGDYLSGYAASAAFTGCYEQARELDQSLAAVRYTLHIRGSRVRVSRFAGEPDYSEEIAATFAGFSQGEVQDYRTGFTIELEMGHVEAGILDLVARLYPDLFQSLADFCGRYRDFADGLLIRFDREIQFYLAWLDYLAPLRAAGLSFCYPQVSADSKEVYAADVFDLALAHKLVPEQEPVVGNDLLLSGSQRLMVITGPNQGGKTTFARAFGQLHYLASIGCPVPGREARLFLARNVLTHFEREEDLASLSGKLAEDLRRLHRTLRWATGTSVIILNEIFTSTAVADALYLSTQILDQVARLDALCVCVTFLDELASFSPSTVSMVSMVVSGDPALRTFKILQRPADGLAYAAAIAEKYGLSHDRVKARVAS